MQGFTNLKDWGFHYFEFSSKFQKKICQIQLR